MQSLSRPKFSKGNSGYHKNVLFVTAYLWFQLHGVLGQQQVFSKIRQEKEKCNSSHEKFMINSTLLLLFIQSRKIKKMKLVNEITKNNYIIMWN